jgi:nucleoside-diphosphate-sugar epimerase
MALITVIGASGRQGLAQVRQALAAGYDVRAISRRPDALEGAPVEGVERVDVRPMTHRRFTMRSKGRITSSIPTRCKPVRTVRT